MDIRKNPSPGPGREAGSLPPPSPHAGRVSSLESTRTLIFRVREGDQPARGRLFPRFLPGLRRWAHGRLPSRARGLVETDDLVQISLLRALARIDCFDPKRQGAFLAYLHQVLMNCIREEIRRASRRPSGEPFSGELPEDRPSLLDRTIGRKALSSYEEALAELPEEQQQAVILRVRILSSGDRGRSGQAVGQCGEDAGRPRGSATGGEDGCARVIETL